MRTAAAAFALLLASTSTFAQRPSDPALLVPQDAPPLGYVSVPDPLRVPDGVAMGATSAVAFDSRGHLWVLTRGELPIMEFDADGRYVRGFGQGLFTRSHGLHVDPEDHVWATDVAGHTVMKFSPRGELLMTLGTRGQPGTINEPTDLVVASSGEIYVSQGHLPFAGDFAQIAKFDRTGRLLKTFGTKGEGPGQFEVPHGIALDPSGRVWVADRENQRIQIFDADGGFVRELQYAGLPCDIYIGEQHVFMVNGFAAQLLQLDHEGRVVAATGSSGKGLGQFGEAHFVAMSPRGEVFVADPTTRRVQKFVRQ